MSKSTAAGDPAERAAELRSVIDEANYRYHVLDDPTMEDQVYDRLMRELQDLEAANPELATPDSPTQRVGAAPSGQFAEVRHQVPMLSLGNAFGHDELREFDTRVLFQMSANDSSNLIDSPSANKLGFHRAIAFSEEQGVLEKFRPYALPGKEWLANAKELLSQKK